MKKLMFAALGAAVTTGAFAAPMVYDYKASVKHMNLKEVRISVKQGNQNNSYTVYQKFVKSASLKGYLIMDDDGLTSATYGGKCDNSGNFSADWGRNRGFLVVMNSNADAKVRAPKILPAVLDAKYIDTNFKKNHLATSGLAEGTLFVGGDTIAPVRPKLETPPTHTENATALTLPAAGTPGLVAYADYVWTSVYLFGQFNGPNWFVDPVSGLSPFDAFETAWDANLPAGLQLAWATKAPVNYFHDTWMNGAGFGKYAIDKWSNVTGDLCCGLKPNKTQGAELYLQSLSGNLKGGLFLCTENGIDAESAAYYWWDGASWEDQFVCCREDGANNTTYVNDVWQNDLWQDGAVEQETTDVLFGSWSIKYNKTFLAKIAVELDLTKVTTADSKAFQAAIDNGVLANGPVATTLPLWACIKGAALKLKKNANVFDGSEIYTKTAAQRFSVPMVTPQFAKYYGLAD